MTDCKNCKYTDEYCVSGDCPNDNSPDYENDIVFKPELTWEELFKWAKKKGLEQGNENYPRSIFIPATEDTTEIHFYEDGYISIWDEEELTISTGRSYEQMKTIIQALYEE